MIALAIMLAIMLQWRRSASFERSAVAANALILAAGFVADGISARRLFRRRQGLMTTEGQISQPLSPGRMLASTAGALIVASAIVFGAILPAEFNLDPLGSVSLPGSTGCGRRAKCRSTSPRARCRSRANIRQASAATRSRSIEP